MPHASVTHDSRKDTQGDLQADAAEEAALTFTLERRKEDTVAPVQPVVLVCLGGFAGAELKVPTMGQMQTVRARFDNGTALDKAGHA